MNVTGGYRYKSVYIYVCAYIWEYIYAYEMQDKDTERRWHKDDRREINVTVMHLLNN